MSEYKCPVWLPRGNPSIPNAHRVRCAVTYPHNEDGHRLPDDMRGLYPKYEVARLEDPTGKHDECWYFVLDPKHDPIARAALAAYADEAANHGFGVLARGIRKRLESTDD